MTAIPAINPDDMSRYRALGSGFVTDAFRNLGIGSWMDDVFPLDPKWKFAGRARIMKFAPRTGIKRCSETNYTMIMSCEPGDVLVIAAMGSHCYTIGENVAHHAIAHGLAGIVTDARVRDTPELLELPLPVFARGPSARPMTDMELVAVDVAVECGGAQVRPGDLILGDGDGIVIVPNEAVPVVIGEAEHIKEVEDDQAAAIARKAPLSELQAIIARKKKRKGPAFDASKLVVS